MIGGYLKFSLKCLEEFSFSSQYSISIKVNDLLFSKILGEAKNKSLISGVRKLFMTLLKVLMNNQYFKICDLLQ